MKKNIIISVIILLLLIQLLVVIAPGTIKFEDNSKTPAKPTSSMNNKLQITDLKEGSGKAVKPGDTVVMNYVGRLLNGKEFDSSYRRKKTFETTIGTGQVIKGWDQGIPGMKTGGKRRLVIPPELGYGQQGNPPVIPANSTLIFEVELLQIK